jgi:hypothetical protein
MKNEKVGELSLGRSWEEELGGAGGADGKNAKVLEKRIDESREIG